MILLCDEGVDGPLVEHLRTLGYEVLYVAEMGPGITDDEVLSEANRREALLLTTDKDFGELIFRQRRLTTGVLLLRLEGKSSGEKKSAVAAALDLHGEELLGAFSVISAGKLRVRRQR